MNQLSNKTLLTALAGAWLLAAAVFVLVPPAGSHGAANRGPQTPLSTAGGNVTAAPDDSATGPQ
jgi:hypothetical protein